MKCPACGREMEPGYLQSDRPVVFTTRRPSLSGVAFPRIPPGPGPAPDQRRLLPLRLPGLALPPVPPYPGGAPGGLTRPRESFPQEAPDVWKTEGGTWRPLGVEYNKPAR